MTLANIPPAPELAGTRHVHSGKVRDLYEITEGEHTGKLLMVASDRLSIFDFVLETTIPDKGEILTRMSLWWFQQLADLVPNHVVSTDVPPEVAGRAVICDNLDMYPVECVARGYLTGSGLLDYVATGEVCGIPLPGGLVDGSRLPQPIFTPATKADLGDHDENVDFAAVVATVGSEVAEELRHLTLRVYGRAEEVARERGIILADTKLEFGVREGGLDTPSPGGSGYSTSGGTPRGGGLDTPSPGGSGYSTSGGTPRGGGLDTPSPGGSGYSTSGGDAGVGATNTRIVLADEVLTPDSSRYWPAAEWEPGRAQPSYDKQIVRNWALSPESGWDRASGEAPPPLPPEVVERTRSRYLEAYELLTGERF